MNRKLQVLGPVMIMASLLLTACGSSQEAFAAGNNGLTVNEVVGSIANNAVKPDSITMLVDGTLITQENGRDEFEKRWEDLTGIDLVIIQPEHDVYYEEVSRMFEEGDLPDVVLLSSTYYTTYAAQEMLADITPYYTGSELEKSVNDAGKSALIDGLKINGKLFGISPTRGNAI